MYVSRMTNDCLLNTWTHNSRIDHGVSLSITGPYEFVDIAVNTWAHNAAPVTLHDGTYAIFHIGNGDGPPSGGQNCTPGPPPPPPSPDVPCSKLKAVPGFTCHGGYCAGDRSGNGNCGATLAEPQLDCDGKDESACAAAAAAKCTAAAGCRSFGLAPAWGLMHAKFFNSGTDGLVPNGQWNVWVRDDDAAAPPQAVEVGPSGFTTFQEFAKTEPAAGSTIHVSASLAGPWTPLEPNTLGGCNNPAPWVHPNGTIYIVCGGSFKRAESIHGPWTTVSSFSHSGGPPGNYEDPYLFTDRRGSFHLIYHVYNTHENPPHGHECFNSTVSAHQYSTDGYTWHTSATSPYGTQVALTSGETVTVATRERPKLFFDAHGQMTHLINGVCGAPNCPNGPASGCVDCKHCRESRTRSLAGERCSLHAPVRPTVCVQLARRAAGMQTRTTRSSCRWTSEAFGLLGLSSLRSA